jgi:hypothetical protein
MSLNFPDEPNDGDIFEGYVYNATRNVWDVKLPSDNNIEDLNNVNVVDPEDGQALIYDADNDEWTSGDVASGPAPAKIIGSNSIAVDFADGIELEKRTVTGDITFTGSNYTSGVHKTIYLEGDDVQRSLTFPNEWTFLTDKPTAIGANKNNILDLNSFGTSASTTVGIWLGQSAFEPIIASGGTVAEILVGGVTYKVHTFNSSGTLSVTSLGSTNYADYLIVAGGGGGGGYFSGGGGGAGGLITSVSGASSGGGAGPSSMVNLGISNYTVVVGIGGTGGNGFATTDGANGGNSSFAGIISIGGGGGGSGARSAISGGSGGGGGGNGGTGASGQSGQGFSGGNGLAFSERYGAGGGGGAGSAGQNGNTSTSGAAGIGVISSINGNASYYAGGGGAGTHTGTDSTRTLGGLGGGGDGGLGGGNNSGFPGIANTGGGGGGATYQNNTGALGGNGASGIVIIRYPITDPN